MHEHIISFAGGIGLFLLGMRLMTDGLRVAAGRALRRILADAPRVAQYYVNMGESAQELARLQAEAQVDQTELAVSLARLRGDGAALLAAGNVASELWSAETVAYLHARFEAAYQQAKMRLLRAGTAGDISPRRMASLLEHSSALRRMCDQSTKAALHLENFLKQHHPAAQDAGISSQP